MRYSNSCCHPPRGVYGTAAVTWSVQTEALFLPLTMICTSLGGTQSVPEVALSSAMQDVALPLVFKSALSPVRFARLITAACFQQTLDLR